MMTDKKEGAKLPNKDDDKNKLQTENPISEKDEVKKAEDRLNKGADPSVAADLKNRKR